MKRGLAVILFSLLLMPLVAAQTSVLDIFFGTSEESVLLLKAMYTALVFVIFYKVSKESVFKETRDARFATVFSLILSLLTMRFTPDSVVTAFGWVITLIAPFAIFYKLTGMFIKPKQGEAERFSWLRFLLALIATLLVLVALGSYSGFSTNIGGTPLVGGFFDELFSDIHYLLFYKLDWFWAMAIVAVVVYLIYALASKLGGGKAGEGGEAGKGIGFGGGLLAALGIGLLLALLGYFLGGGLGFFGALASPLIGIGETLLYVLLGVFLLLALIGLGWLLVLYRKKVAGGGKYAGKGIRWSIKGIAWLIWNFLKGLVWFLLNLIKGLGWFGKRSWNGAKRISGAIGGKNVYVTLRVPKKTIRLFDRDRTILVAPGSTTPLFVTISQGRTQVTSEALQGVECIFIVDNGTVAPNNVVSDEKGRAGIVYKAPAGEGTARLQLNMTSPDAPTIEPYTIKIETERKHGEETPPEGEEPKEKEGKLSITITSPKEGDVFTSGSAINVAFTAQGARPAAYAILFSSVGLDQKKFAYLEGALNPDAREFVFELVEESEECYIQIQPLDEKGRPLGFFTSGPFAVRRTKGKAPVREEEEITEEMEQPLKGKIAGLIGPPLVLLSPLENEKIPGGKTLQITWRVEGIEKDSPTDALLGYSVQRPGEPYTGIARVRMKEKLMGMYNWSVPTFAEGTELYIRIYIPEIGADRVFGPFTVMQGSFGQRIKDIFQGKPKAEPTFVPEESEVTPPPKQLTDAGVSPSLVLLSPSENTIEEGKLVTIAWEIKEVSASFSADIILGYSIQGSRGPYSGIARVTTKRKGLYTWNVPMMPEGTIVYLRLYVPEISTDRVFGPFYVSIGDAGGERAGPTLVPEEQKTGLIHLPDEEDEVTSKIKAPEEQLEILLVAPIKNEYITKKTYEIKWRFLQVPKYFTTDLTIAAVVDEETYVIREKKSGTVGTVIWNVPEVTHDIDAYLEFVIPGLASQRFGPFKLKGTETEDLEIGIEVLEASLGQIKLPFKRSRLSKKVDVGTFLYYLVSTNEMDNYFTNADRLKEIAQQIENPVVQKKLGNLYGQYLGKLHEIEETRQRLQGLEKRSEVRARLLQLFGDKSNGFIRIINKSLLEDFKKHYGVDIRRLTAAQITNNVNYMAWVMERAQMIDELMGVSGSNMGLRSLYRFVEYTMDQTEVLSKQLQDVRELARKMKKQLKSR